MISWPQRSLIDCDVRQLSKLASLKQCSTNAERQAIGESYVHETMETIGFPDHWLLR
ncbi:hypothetical protein BH11ARM1_BH11ARM1_16980 [soil metagenome]